MDINIITRKEAIKRGLKRYFTGKSCGKGHLCERQVCDRGCIDCKTERVSSWREANREATNLQARNYNKQNKEAHKLSAKKWKSKNKARLSYLEIKRYCAKKNRTPSWANHEEINFFYECKPMGFEVDHIIPLQGRFVSGLHVENNLQWLTKEENRSKGNRV